ncbi:T9SS type A sorting domain-containing protein [Bacteroidota bacterium]
MKKWNYLYWMFFIIVLCCSYRASITQIITQWEFADINTNRDYSISFYNTKTIAGLNENDIILCSDINGYDSSKGEKEYINDKIIEIITNKGEEKKEIYRISDKYEDEDWNAVAHPSSNVIVIVGDSIYSYTAGNQTVKVHYNFLTISRDGGKNWERSIYDSNQYLLDVSMCDSLHGIIIPYNEDNIANPLNMSNHDSLWVTDDCWKTIRKKALPEDSGYYRRIFCLSEEKYALLTYNSKSVQSYINFTSDGGKSWKQSDNIGQNILIREAVFTDISAYAIGTNKLATNFSCCILFRSRDGGNSWDEVKNIYDSDFYSTLIFTGLDFYDDMNGIVITKHGEQSGQIKRTSDGGDTWTTEFTPYSPIIKGNENPLYQVYYPNNDFAIATWYNDAIIKSETKQGLSIPKFNRMPHKSYQPVNKVTVSWNNVEGAENYQVKIAKTYSDGDPDSTSFSNPLIDTTLSGNSMTLNNLYEKMIYNGWIRALGNNLSSNWSIKHNLFYTLNEENILYPPDIIYPVKNSMNMPTDLTVCWTKVPGAVHYNMYVLFDYSINTGSNLWDYYDNIEDTMLTLEGLDANRGYFLKLSSFSEDAHSDYSSSLFITGDVTAVDDNELDINNYLSVFPNPAHGKGTITINADEVSPAEIVVYNILGVEVRRFEFMLNEGGNVIPINLTNLPSGMYYLKVRTNDKVFGGKIIKN